MKAWLLRAPGEGLHWLDVPTPALDAGQVLVAVKAAGANAGDLKPAPAPFTPGREFSGIVEETGADVSAFKAGDRVFGLARAAHAEKVICDAVLLMPLPDAVDFTAGAALAVQWMSAWHAVVTLGNAQPGQKVRIDGPAFAAAQIAAHRGCILVGAGEAADVVAALVNEDFSADTRFLSETVPAFRDNAVPLLAAGVYKPEAVDMLAMADAAKGASMTGRYVLTV